MYRINFIILCPILLSMALYLLKSYLVAKLFYLRKLVPFIDMCDRGRALSKQLWLFKTCIVEKLSK